VNAVIVAVRMKGTSLARVVAEPPNRSPSPEMMKNSEGLIPKTKLGQFADGREIVSGGGTRITDFFDTRHYPVSTSDVSYLLILIPNALRQNIFGHKLQKFEDEAEEARWW
jgi:hypothetical protein